jgi:Xaa-Pro aminopeptidase
MNVDRIPQYLRTAGLDGWLFTDHHERDPLAYRILGFHPQRHVTRRWYYFVPAEGEPQGLVHRIEPRMLDALPGKKLSYSGWREQVEHLRNLLAGCGRIAMQYSPNCSIPYISMVDAGTVELIRSFGVQVESSANLVQVFEAVWNREQLAMHLEAGRRIDAIREAAFEEIRRYLNNGVSPTEWEIKSFILRCFDRDELYTDHGPIVAVGAHTSDPHYEPQPDGSEKIHVGDLILIDLWAKLRAPGAVYYDVTWTGYCGNSPPPAMDHVFEVVKEARDKAIDLVREARSVGAALRGFEVDDTARSLIAERGYGEFFVHRTGHSIGEDVHGAGANMDNLETHDERLVIAGTCTSIEPGIYLPEFGIRSEVNLFIEEQSARVTGEIQQQLLRLL